MRRPLLGAAALALALAVADGVAAPQTVATPALRVPSGKTSFVESLLEFTTAIYGTYGDEGRRAWSSLDAMQKALDGWDAGIREYETAVRAQIESVETHVALAAVYLDRGRLADALPELTAASRLEPKRPELHAFQGLVFGLMGKPAEAAESFGRASALDPAEPSSFYERALHLRALGRLDDAADAERRFEAAQRARLFGSQPVAASRFTRPALLQVGAAAPIFLLARYSDGATALREGDYRRAIQQFRLAAASDPLSLAAGPAGNQAGAVIRAGAALRRGALHAALEQLTSVVASAPTDTEAQRLLGMALWADERYDLSAEHLRDAVAADPENERARLALADVLVTAGRHEEAEAVLLDSITRLPASGQARYRLGKLYHDLGRYPEAIQAFEAAADLGALTGLDSLYRVMGLVQALQQDVDGAIEAYRRQIDANPNDPAAHRSLGETLRGLDRYDEARTEYVAALFVDPRDTLALGAIATIHLQQGQYADALEAAQRALALDDADKEAQYVAATALVRLGRTEEGTAALERFRRLQEATLARDRRVYELNALRREASLQLERGDAATAVARLEEAVEQEPSMPELHADLGRALLEAGRPQEAIAHFGRAAELNPGADVHRQLAEAYGTLGQEAERQRHLAMYEREKEERLRRGAFR